MLISCSVRCSAWESRAFFSQWRSSLRDKIRRSPAPSLAIVMEGFLNFRITPWLRRLITRALAIIPAVLIIGIFGEGKTTQLLVASQVVLSMQLGFAVWPLMRFTDEKAKMGEFANRLWLKILGWTVAGIIIVLNVKLLFDTFMPAAILKAIYRLLGLPAPMQ